VGVICLCVLWYLNADNKLGRKNFKKKGMVCFTTRSIIIDSLSFKVMIVRTTVQLALNSRFII